MYVCIYIYYIYIYFKYVLIAPPVQKAFVDHVKNLDVKFVISTDSFKSTTTSRTYFIRLEKLKYSSENVVYLFTRITCSKQYTGSTEDFWSRFNNYRCPHRNILKGKKVKQESFKAHFAEVNHSFEDD